MRKEKVLRFTEAKGVNTRINVYLINDPKRGDLVIVNTKRLIDFKKRIITSTDIAYSIETIKVLTDILSMLFNDSEVKNKILLKELSEIEQYSTVTNIEH